MRSKRHPKRVMRARNATTQTSQKRLTSGHTSLANRCPPSNGGQHGSWRIMNVHEWTSTVHETKLFTSSFACVDCMIIGFVNYIAFDTLHRHCWHTCGIFRYRQRHRVVQVLAINAAAQALLLWHNLRICRHHVCVNEWPSAPNSMLRSTSAHHTVHGLTEVMSNVVACPTLN